MTRTNWCGQVAAPKANRMLALSRSAGARPSSEPLRQCGAVEAFAALVEDDGDRLVRNHVGERDRFLNDALADLLGAAFADFHNFRIAETDPAAGLLGAFAIALGQFPFRAVLEPTNRRNDQPHGRLPAFAHVL